MKKYKLVLALVFCFSAFSISGCGLSSEISSSKETKISISEDGYWIINGEKTNIKAQGEKGETGNSVLKIELTSQKENIDTYTIYFSDGMTSKFEVRNGKDGATGAQGLPGKDGHTPVISIGENGNWIIDGIDSNISALGLKGDKGNDGKGIEKIELVSSLNNVDTYIIYFNDGTTTSFTITNGKDGETPIIGENGNWWIGEVDTGIKAKGEDGKTPTITISEDGYWVINEEKTHYRTGLTLEELEGLLDEYFILKNEFVLEKETTKSPCFSYTTSTFSGWTGSIGNPQKVNTIAFKIRARDKAINSIKVYLNKTDKNGEQIVSATINTNIEPYEEKEIYWTLPEEFINEANDYLYFGFACDNFCDAYSNFSTSAKIPSDEPQAIQCYITNGKQPDSLSSFVNVVDDPCRYYYVKLGRMKNHFVPSDYLNDKLNKKINVFLPDEYYLAVNDNFQLFYRGVMQAVNPYNYHIEIKTKHGKVFPRYYEWKPSEEDVGTYDLTLNVYDDNHNLLGTDKTHLIVNNAAKTHQKENILCFGDSLTSGGYWVEEAYRRFSLEDGNPIGDGKDYLNFIGTKKSSKYIECGYEGTGGWTWNTYLSEKSPFYNTDTGKIDFQNYVNINDFEDIDYVYILLTWNGMSESFKDDFRLDEGHFKNAQILLDQLHNDFPEAKVRLMGLQMPSQNGGMGTNYNVNSPYGDAYGMLVTAMNYNKTLEELTNLDKYSSFVNYIDIAGQFDTDYNMPSSEKPANNRTDVTEIIGTNGVHPTINGYYQIADTVYRSLYNDFKI